MNRRLDLLQTIEDLFYAICLLVVFYPWYMACLIVRPRAMLHEYRDAVIGPDGNHDLVSPPLFLLITAAVTVVLLPPVDFGNRTTFSAFAGFVTADAELGKVVAVSLPLILLAIIAALITEWKTPGGVTRQSFHLPLFMAMLVSAVLLMVLAIANALMVAVPIDRLHAAATGVVVLTIGFGWYVNAQSRIFDLLTGCSRWTGAGLAILALALNEAASMLLPQG